MTYVPLDSLLRIQVLPDINYLPQCQKHHFAAFIQDPSLLIVWDDDPNHLLSRAQSIEDHLMGMIWNVGDQDNDRAGMVEPSKTESGAPSVQLKADVNPLSGKSEESLVETPRKIVLIQPTLTAVVLTLILAAIGDGWREIAIELKTDHGWIRLAFLAVVPLQIWLGLVSSPFSIHVQSRLTFPVLYANPCRLPSAASRPC